MKKLLFALIIVSLISCTASRVGTPVSTTKEKIYKKVTANIDRYFKEYKPKERSHFAI
jgi:hypothetical protein